METKREENLVMWCIVDRKRDQHLQATWKPIQTIIVSTRTSVLPQNVIPWNPAELKRDETSPHVSLLDKKRQLAHQGVLRLNTAPSSQKRIFALLLRQCCWWKQLREEKHWERNSIQAWVLEQRECAGEASLVGKEKKKWTNASNEQLKPHKRCRTERNQNGRSSQFSFSTKRKKNLGKGLLQLFSRARMVCFSIHQKRIV